MPPKRNDENWFQRNSNRRSIPEKGIHFNEQDGIWDQFIAQLIQDYQWEEFSHPPGDFCLELVLEFYQNINSITNISMVRGRPINFSAEAINGLYFLEEVDDRETMLFLENPNYDLVESELCPRGANWAYNSEGQKNKLLRKNIGYCARPILSFIGSRLLPNLHQYDIYMPRVALLYAICMKKPLNVGRFINTHMINCRNDLNVRSLWYPSTITLLCRINGVHPSPRMVVYRYSKCINKSFWNRMERVEGPRGQEPLPESRSQHERSVRHQIGQLTRQFARMNLSFDNMERRFGNLEERIDRGFQRVEHIQMQDIIYNSSMICTLSNMQCQMAEIWGFTGMPSYPPIYWANPATTPIPRFYTPNDIQTPVQQQPDDPPAQPLTPIPSDPISHHSSNFFSNLPDLSNIDVVDCAEIYPFSTGALTIREGNPPKKKANTMVEGKGKGKAVVVNEDTSSESDSDENWVPIDLLKGEGTKRKK